MYASLDPFDAYGKAQVVDDTPMCVGALDFGVMPQEEIQKQAQIEVSDRNLYNLDPARTPTAFGPLDRRLGTSSKTSTCSTCYSDQRSCNGHWGFVRLEAPCFHIGYLSFTIDILNQICKSCSRILLSEKPRKDFIKSLRRPNVDSFQKKAYLRKIQAECKKVRRCPTCDASNGPVRKVPGHACKLVHLKFEAYLKSTAKSKKPPPDKILFDHSLQEYLKTNPENARHIKRAVDDLPAIKVHRLFCNIPTEDCELLGIDLNKGRPESYLWTYLPVPPSNIRPSVPGDQGTTEDELTTKLSEIIDLNTLLKGVIERSEHISFQMDYYEKLQDHIAMYINSHAPGLNKSEYGKAIRSFCSRLKGKQGRFRGNLSGKRVNFSGRTVISPDPNLSVEEVGIPVHVAKILSYPETVTKHNIEILQEMILRGSEQWPGANGVRKRDGWNVAIRVISGLGHLQKVAANLQLGDVVNRHLINGDIVLFNRQPSLHKLSILCHRVRVHSGRTFRFNESVCNPYNADFDGDEMNIHVPQSEEARAEAIELMGVKHNLVTPKNGAPIIAPIQDFITAAYLLSNKDKFFTKAQFSQIMGWMFDATGFEDPDTGEYQGYALPPPTIWKPNYLWTGKQIFNVLMRPSKKCKVLVNLEAKLPEFQPIPGQPPEMSPTDSYLVVRNSEIMCGVLDKSAIGHGKKTSVFFVMLRDFGEDYAVQGMNRMAKLASRWLAQQGFSIGVGDVYPGKTLEEKKTVLIDKAYAQTEIFIEQYRLNQLPRLPGCTEVQTLETKISKILSDVRNDAGAVCFEELSRHNAAVIMAKSGAKGSMINVSQMTAGVGQQMISQKRVENGFQDRTLPHFPKGSLEPRSKGFVSNSFFSGLTPTEFIFHAMSGREGLVDTAVKTAETGYMSRRLIKSLEDAFVVYDNTVRNSSGNVIQFSFGDDFLDPTQLEGDKQPVNFGRTFSHATVGSYSEF
jgi:DNA-directed RNA polymerase III subunit RPC1